MLSGLNCKLNCTPAYRFIANTRKLSNHKDDRDAPYGCHEDFRESLTTPTTTFPDIFNGLLFRSIPRMCVQNLKFVALPVPEIIGDTQNIRQSLDYGYVHAAFSPKFLMGFICSDGPTECTGQI